MLLMTCCVIVGEVIAASQDGTQQHPLRHAIMAAIDAAAARDRWLWPSSGTQTQETSAALSAAHEPFLPSHSVASDDDATETNLPGAQNILYFLCTAKVTFPACTLIVFCIAWLQDCQGACWLQ